MTKLTMTRPRKINEQQANFVFFRIFPGQVTTVCTLLSCLELALPYRGDVSVCKDGGPDHASGLSRLDEGLQEDQRPSVLKFKLDRHSDFLAPYASTRYTCTTMQVDCFFQH